MPGTSEASQSSVESVDLRSRLSTLRGQLTRVEKYLQQPNENLSISALQRRQTSIDSHLEAARVAHRDFLRSLSSQADLDSEMSYMESDEERVEMVKDMIDQKMNQLLANHQPQDRLSSEGGLSQMEDLTKTLAGVLGLTSDFTKDVPNFDGSDVLKFRNWIDVWEQTATLMGRAGLTEVQMLTKLKSKVDGQAFTLIENLSPDPANYNVAMKTLKQFYNNPVLQVRSVMDQLIDLPQQLNMFDLHAKINSIDQSFDGLQLTSDQLYNLMFINLCLRKVPTEVSTSFAKAQRRLREQGDPNVGVNQKRSTLIKLLSQEAEDYISRKSCNNHKSKLDRSDIHKLRPTAPSSFNTQNDSGQKRGQDCPFCKKPRHKIGSDCPALKSNKISRDDVLNAIKAYKLCTRCLTVGHRGTDCSVVPPCATCNKNHSKWVCRGPYVPPWERDGPVERGVEFPPSFPGANPTPSSNTTHSSEVGTYAPSHRAICKSLDAFLVGPNKEQVKVRVLLDSQSQVNLVRKSIANRLGLNGPRCTLAMTVSGGSTVRIKGQRIVKFQLKSLSGSFISPMVEGCTTNQVAANQLPLEFDQNEYSHLKGIKFAEGAINSGSNEVDVLIGEPLYTHLIVDGPIRGRLFEPAAQGTKLGTTITGALPAETANPVPRVHWQVITTNESIDLSQF